MMEVAATPPPARLGSPIHRAHSPMMHRRSPSPIRRSSPMRRSPSPSPPTSTSMSSRSLLPPSTAHSVSRQHGSPDIDRHSSLHSPTSRPSAVGTPPLRSTLIHSSSNPPLSSPGSHAPPPMSPHAMNPLSAAALSAGGHGPFLGGNAFPVPLPSTPTSVAMMAAAAAGMNGGIHHSHGGLNLPSKPTYSSPPPAPNNADNNTCAQIDYRGARVAAFNVDGRQLICLPQAFELFLKHLVGGLHTVYTKLKRLDITPIVCNVEQVRILRGLGAIQPGVNRCKLIAPSEFDILYEDCTNSNARPGRPPKRSPSVSGDAIEKFKKSRLDNGDFSSYHHHNRMLGYMFPDPKKSPLFGNGYHYPPHLASMPFMPLGHPMMSMAMANQMNLRPDAPGLPHITAEHRIKEDDPYHSEDNNNHPLDKPLNLQVDKPEVKQPPHSITKETDADPVPIRVPPMDTKPSYPHAGLFPHHLASHPAAIYHQQQQQAQAAAQHAQAAQQVQAAAAAQRREIEEDDFSGSEPLTDDEKENEDIFNRNESTPAREDRDADLDKHIYNQSTTCLPDKATNHSMAYNSTGVLTNDNSNFSSVETLLLNIQGLLKVAVENARHRENQINCEKAELKMEVIREKTKRDTLERQLTDEKTTTNILHRRLKKEKSARRKMQDQLEGSSLAVSSSNMSPAPISAQEDTYRMSSTSPDHGCNRSLEDSFNSRRDYDKDRSMSSSPPEQQDQPDHRMLAAAGGRSGLQSLMETFLGPQSSAAFLHAPPPVIKATENSSA